MKKTMSLILVAIMVMALPIALAEIDASNTITSVVFDADFEFEPGNRCPEIKGWGEDYHVTTWYNLLEETCTQGCLPTEVLSTLEAGLESGKFARSYAFEGELISINFTAEDQDGFVDECTRGYMTITCQEDPRVVECVKSIDGDEADFVCNYYVEDAEIFHGDCWISVSVEDGCQQGCSDNKPGIFSVNLNPAVGITYAPQVMQGQTAGFGFYYNKEGDLLQYIVNGQVKTGAMPGETAYTPFFTVENSADAETGLYILLQMYGTDFKAPYTSTDVPKCADPITDITSNVLTIENMEYMARHLNEETVKTSDLNGDAIGPWNDVADVPQLVFGEYSGSNPEASFLGVGDDVTMRLRLHIPSPCQGSFTDGGEVMFVATVI